MVRFSCTAIIGTMLAQPMSAMGLGTDATVAGGDCAVHFVAGGALCGEVAMPCAMSLPVKAILKDFKDGHCADVGESIKQIESHSFAGATISAYVGNFAGNNDMAMDLTVPAEKCAVRFVAGGALCGEAAMSCALVSPVKAIFKDFEDGYCADAGESLKQIDTHTFAGVTVSAFVGNFGSNVTGDVVLKASSNPDWWPDWLPSLPDICVPGITPQVTIYDEAGDYGIPCGEIKLDCQLVELAKLLRPFKTGTCAKAGYSVQAHQWPFEFPFFEKIAFTIFEKTQPPQTKCTVNLPAGAMCGEVTTFCDLIPALKSFVDFTEGECSAELYKLIPGSAGDVFEDVTVSGFIDKTVPVPEISGKTCNVFDLGEEWAVKHGVPCAQAAMDCALVEPAKAMRDTLKDGECADAGFAVEKKSLWARTLWIPLAGDVVIKVFGTHKGQQILV